MKEIISAKKYKYLFDNIKCEKDLYQKFKFMIIILWQRVRGNFAAIYTHKKKYCIACGNTIYEWLPWGSHSAVYKNHNIIGGGYRKCLCPICNSIDRYRWLEYVLYYHTHIFDNNKRILHFAPEQNVKRVLKQKHKNTYVSADINPDEDDEYIDITDIHYKNSSFDYIIVNHVASYISDEKRLWSELIRCLTDDGKIIVSFPIRTDVKTYEKFNLSLDESEKEFGTAGNCRMYGNDYKEHLEGFGVHIISEYSPSSELSSTEIEQYGFLPNDIIIIAGKK